MNKNESFAIGSNGDCYFRLHGLCGSQKNWKMRWFSKPSPSRRKSANNGERLDWAYPIDAWLIIARIHQKVKPFALLFVAAVFSIIIYAEIDRTMEKVFVSVRYLLTLHYAVCRGQVATATMWTEFFSSLTATLFTQTKRSNALWLHLMGRTSHAMKNSNFEFINFKRKKK